MVTLDTLVSLAKRRGFVYPTSEIYGGLSNSYDYGPLGAQLLRNIRNVWWREFIEKRGDIVGLDSQILLHPHTWVASGHVASFFDPLVEDSKTHKRYRADHVIEAWLKVRKDTKTSVEDMTIDHMDEFIAKNTILSPDGNALTKAQKFNLLFETQMGVIEGKKTTLYLRGETAQGIFTNFLNVVQSTRVSLPFGIGQIGKSFRNEITLGQFIFRTLELEQAEIEYFFNPAKNDWQALYKEWQERIMHFVTNTLGVQNEHVRWRRHTDKERSFYSKETYDLDYNFPFGWKELWGLAYRTDYDLKQHMKQSNTDISYIDKTTGEKIIPHVIEPAVGINRILLMLLADCYREEEGRVYLRFKRAIAPYEVAVFPLVSNKEDIVARARGIFSTLNNSFRTYWDDRGNIGKRYRYQDEVGTSLCVTIDYQTLTDDTITVRDRNTMKQDRVAVTKLINYITSHE